MSIMMTFEEFLKDEEVNSIKASTIAARRSLLKRANKYKSFSEWDKEVFNQYILSIQKTCKIGTVEMTKSTLRKFFNWAGKPEIVAHIKVKMPKTSIKRAEILSVSDVNRLIENTESPMYKALISFLFESGGRINEVLSVHVKDVQETDQGMIISVHSTKTGEDDRRGLYIFSTGYIRNHITYSGLGKEDRLFPVKRSAVFDMLQKIERKAKTGKKVNPHSFRHARATDLVLRGFNESIIRKHLGWVGDSKMIATYQHIVDEDVINAFAENGGYDIPRKPVVDNLNKAEPLKIVDAGLQLEKVMEDNRMIVEKNQAMEADVKALQEIVELQFTRNDELKREMGELKKRIGELLAELHGD